MNQTAQAAQADVDAINAAGFTAKQLLALTETVITQLSSLEAALGATGWDETDFIARSIGEIKQLLSKDKERLTLMAT